MPTPALAYTRTCTGGGLRRRGAAAAASGGCLRLRHRALKGPVAAPRHGEARAVAGGSAAIAAMQVRHAQPGNRLCGCVWLYLWLWLWQWLCVCVCVRVVVCVCVRVAVCGCVGGAVWRCVCAFGRCNVRGSCEELFGWGNERANDTLLAHLMAVQAASRCVP